MRGPRIFISHASGDKGTIKPIAEALLRSGYGLFIDRPEDFDWGIRFCRENDISFLGGGDFGVQLRVAVREAHAILGCLSSNLTNERQVWKEELLVGEHLEKLVLCRIDDVMPADFDAIDTGTIQLERLQSRRIRVPNTDPLEPVASEVVEKLLDNPAFSFVLYELEQLTGSVDASKETDPVQAPVPVQVPSQTANKTDPSRERVELSYPTHSDAEETTLPCVIKVMSDLGCDDPLPPVNERRFLSIDLNTFEEYMRATRPCLNIRVENKLVDEGGLLAVHFTPQSLDDFTPSAIARQVPALYYLHDRRMSLQSLVRMMDGKPDAEEQLNKLLLDPDLIRMVALASRHRDHDDEDSDESASLESSDELSADDLAAMLEQAFRVRSDYAAHQLRTAVGYLCEFALQDSMLVSDGILDTISSIIWRLDDALTRQIDEILHHPDYLRLESAWRGLWHLVDASAEKHGAQIQVMNITKVELGREFKKYPGSRLMFSPVHKWLVDTAFDTLGGVPTTCVVADYYFGHGSADVNLLYGFSKIAAAAQTVVLTAPSPELMQLDGWAELPLPVRLHEIHQTPEYAKWNSLRDSLDSQFIALTAPRFAARAPFGPDNPDPDLNYEEELGTHWAEKICWANAAYVVAANISRASARFGWPSQVTGIEGAAAIEKLPTISLIQEGGSFETLCPTEVEITLNRARELERLGVMPLVHRRGSTRAALLGTNTLHRPLEYIDERATLDARQAIDLDRLLPACHVNHLLRCMIRDLAPSLNSIEELNEMLNAWLNQYAVEGHPPTAKHPLGHSGVTVEETKIARASIVPKYHIRGEATPIGLEFGFDL